ncbi:thioredoxin family protein [Lentibacillus daqui]|uniref:thioredoxin family protein n=1 Tax=Lentibacillus daqui TaxID=2911514 RepID=UPI0022B12CD4|nr:thioredoxin family protein [Lentibacillus daqui]
MEFTELTSLSAINDFIRNHQLSFLFISRPDCSVCHGLFPQVQVLMKNYPEVALGHINADQVPEIAGAFSVFTVPILLFFIDGKEYIREARIVPLDLLEEKINKIYQHMAGSSE